MKVIEVRIYECGWCGEYVTVVRQDFDRHIEYCRPKEGE